MILSIEKVAAKVGGVVALSTKLGLSRGAVSNWKNGIPVARVKDVAKLTGIPKEFLHPDFADELPARRRKAA